MKTYLCLTLASFLLSTAVFSATTQSIAELSFGYGVMDISTGGGDLEVTIENNKIADLTIDAYATDPDEGLFGEKTHILEVITLAQLSSGKTLSFPTDGSNEVLFKITALENFGANGGDIKISMKEEDGFSSQIVKVARSSQSGLFGLWKQNKKVKEIGINLRGDKPNSFVGWYEFN